ncbi:hypothetical protein IF2G_09258 [Cordyceps javanica]|nr:hypothetical protein IF2G_09258 [Cordyceps javanica]
MRVEVSKAQKGEGVAVWLMAKNGLHWGRTNHLPKAENRGCHVCTASGRHQCFMKELIKLCEVRHGTTRRQHRYVGGRQ